MTRHPGEDVREVRHTWKDWVVVAATIVVAVPVGMLIEYATRKRKR